MTVLITMYQGCYPGCLQGASGTGGDHSFRKGSFKDRDKAAALFRRKPKGKRGKGV
jgi:hypothetical protein